MYNSFTPTLPAFLTLTANLIATAIYVIGIFGQALGGKGADRYSLRSSCPAPGELRQMLPPGAAMLRICGVANKRAAS